MSHRLTKLSQSTMDLSFFEENGKDSFIFHVKQVIEMYIALRNEVEVVRSEKVAVDMKLNELRSKYEGIMQTPQNTKKRKTETEPQNCATISPHSDAFNDAIRDCLNVDDDFIAATPTTPTKPIIKADAPFSPSNRSPLKVTQEMLFKTEKSSQEIEIEKVSVSNNSVSVLNPANLCYLKENTEPNSSASTVKWQSKLQLKDKATTASKRLSLISKIDNKQKRLTYSRQSDSDNDETYCEDIIAPSQKIPEKKPSVKSKNLRQRSIITSFRNAKPKEKKCFYFPEPKTSSAVNNKSKKVEPIIKLEKSTPEKCENKIQDELSSAVTQFTTSDSVFAVPNDTDEIIIINESEDILASLNESADLIGNFKEEFHATKQLPPIEKQTEKEKLSGYECPECALYFKYIGDGLSNKQIQNRINQCSRHKRVANLNATPDGFWIPYFVPTQEDDKIKTQVDYRFVNRKNNN